MLAQCSELCLTKPIPWHLNFAISSSGIGEALQRSASALAAAGNTIDESIGLIVAANDVVQNPEAVGERELRPAA